jgi:SAM-dependent methyltransferase
MTIQRRLAWLKKSPLHPQWLVLRDEQRTIMPLLQSVRGRVIDIGCGDRWVERHLPAKCEYIAIDYPPTIAMGYAGGADLLANGEALPLADGSIDGVVMLSVLEHIPHPEQAIAEAARVLRPEGRLIIEIPFLYPLHDQPHDYQRWTRHGIVSRLTAAGFEVKQIGSFGQPIASSATLTAIALAKAVIDGIQQRHPIVLLAPLLIAAIPLINLSGWLLARLAPHSDFMPLSYQILAEKRP